MHPSKSYIRNLARLLMAVKCARTLKSKDCLQAFLAASMKSDAELAGWFKERLVWDNQETVIEMLKSGLFVRAYEPQVCFSLIHTFTFLQLRHLAYLPANRYAASPSLHALEGITN